MSKYHSYLLRIWREGSSVRPSWRFTLTSLGDDRQRGFATLEKLVDFVRAQMDEIVASEWDINEEPRKE
jgi:hypothetical protein